MSLVPDYNENRNNVTWTRSASSDIISDNMTRLGTVLQLLLPLLSIKTGAKSTFIGSQVEVFSDLVESLMFDAIKKGQEITTDKRAQDSVELKSEDFAQKSQKILDGQVSRRRMIQRSKFRVPIAKMKTREVVSDDQEKTRNFFSSKKIISRQRKHGGNEDTGTQQTSASQNSGEKTENKKENLQSRLEKLRELFQMVKISKKYKTNKSNAHPRLSSRRIFLQNHQVHGDNNNDADIKTLKARSDTADKADKTEALANLFKIAGDEWVRTNVNQSH